MHDDEHRDELPQTSRRKAISVRGEAENYRDEDETNKSNTETVWSGESDANVREIPESCSLTN